MKAIIKTIIWVTFWVLFAFCCGCSAGSGTWNNTNITIDPGNMHQITVQKNAAAPEILQNGKPYSVKLDTWKQTETKNCYFRLAYSGPVKVDFAWFTGYYNLKENESGQLVKDLDLEMQFEERTATSFVISGRLLPANEYQLNLSEDLLN